MLREELILLVIPDDVRARALLEALRRNGLWAEQVRTARQAHERLRMSGASLVILDLELPDRDGLELCREIAARGETPCIAQTNRGDLATRLAAFASGADDLVAIGTHPLELVARVRAVLHRCRAPQEATPPVFRHNGLLMDTAAHRVEINGQRVHLTPMEFRLLRTLVETPNRAFTRDELISRTHAFDAPAGSDRSIDLHVTSLRRKLGDSPKRPKYIESVRGVGYRLAASRGSRRTRGESTSNPNIPAVRWA